MVCSHGALAAVPQGAMFPEGESILYSRVLQAYHAGQLPELKRSNEMLQKYFPQSTLVDNAYYYKGLLEMQKGYLPEALHTFDIVDKQFPLSNKRAGSLFAKGIVLQKLNMGSTAQSVFKRLIENYPGSVEALRAKNELRLMKGSGTS
jgi:TolA-binding protein